MMYVFNKDNQLVRTVRVDRYLKFEYRYQVKGGHAVYYKRVPYWLRRDQEIISPIKEGT